MVRGFVSLALAVMVLATLPVAFAQSASQQEQQAAIFLEQILRPWSLVLKPWDRDATSAEWASTKADCMTPKKVESTKPVGDAEDALPPESELFGSLAFYRGAMGLQSIELPGGTIEVFPNVQVGVSQTGAPAYQISNDDRTIQIIIGKVPMAGKPSVMMIFDGGLYLSCRQPVDDS
ncbi:MAG: hypothetical protein ACR2PF_20475 [Rhizobiaceae bacterium]